VTDKNAANSRIRSFSAVNSERKRKGVIFNLIAAWRLPHEDRWGISCPSVFFVIPRKEALMLKWGAVQDGTSFPEFNHARLLETWKLLLQFAGKQQKSKN